MLAEKFILLLETLINHSSDDEPHVVISRSPHIAIKLPPRKKVSPTEDLFEETRRRGG
jgi:hypothetical protein